MGIIKALVHVATSVSVGRVIDNLVWCSTPTNITNFGKVVVGFGGGVLGWAIGEKVAAQVDTFIDDMANLKNKNNIKEEFLREETDVIEGGEA